MSEQTLPVVYHGRPAKVKVVASLKASTVVALNAVTAPVLDMQVATGAPPPVRVIVRLPYNRSEFPVDDPPVVSRNIVSISSS